MLSLIVKGNKLEAARAAANRAIPFVFVREVRTTLGVDETATATFCEVLAVVAVGLTGDQHREKVARWFVAHYTPPFPAGTLLSYTTKEDDGGPISSAYPWYNGPTPEERTESDLTPAEIREERSVRRGEALMQDPDIEED